MSTLAFALEDAREHAIAKHAIACLTLLVAIPLLRGASIDRRSIAAECCMETFELASRRDADA
ncbi:MAG TPA: hypothetical protein VGM90_16345 [Kofleriaceae bacterium]|jgi:hypothetical protein